MINPFLQFAPEATPHLLPIPEEDQQFHIQRVKFAKEYLVAVTSIQTESDGQHAT